jgi:hypothetical protein
MNTPVSAVPPAISMMQFAMMFEPALAFFGDH